MAKVAVNEQAYQGYLIKKNWQCSLSPTGGHHWLSRDAEEFVCKYCGEIRKMAADYVYNSSPFKKKDKNDKKNQ